MTNWAKAASAAVARTPDAFVEAVRSMAMTNSPERDVIREIIQKQINDALECAAKAVYDSEYAWNQNDQSLLDAATRVRSLKIPVGAEEDQKR